METSYDIDELRRQVSSKHIAAYSSPDELRMIGLVFAPPTSKLAKHEILPQISDWHYRSGDNIDFYFLGYRSPSTPNENDDREHLVRQVETEDWYFSGERFNRLLSQFGRVCRYEYSGGADLVLLNARIDSLEQADLDFDSAIVCRLDQMLKDKAILSVGYFFESIFRFVESYAGDDPTWGFSDSKGKGIVKGGVIEVVLSILPRQFASSYRRGGHFAVRQLRRA